MISALVREALAVLDQAAEHAAGDEDFDAVDNARDLLREWLAEYDDEEKTA